jgi:hypothetical protein
MAAPPSHGGWQLAFRPACASWMPATAPWEWTNRATRASGSTCWSPQMPMSFGVIRPSAVTAVASTTTSPTPPAARLPRWTRCQSLASPSSELYWHIGDMTMRLRRVTPRTASGLSRSSSGTSRSWSAAAGQPRARSSGPGRSSGVTFVAMDVSFAARA